MREKRRINAVNLELLLRPTTFSSTILAEMWDGLGLLERVSVLLRFLEESRGLFGEKMKIKVLNDPSPVVRMLAVRCCHIIEEYEPDLYAKLKADPSALVRAAMNSDVPLFDKEEFGLLSHIERLGVIALSDYVWEEEFAEFIVDGLQSAALQEKEAAELVVEFVRNPKLLHGKNREPEDGLDWYSMNKAFEAIWNLTTCTPARVHHAIAWEYPLEIGDSVIPDEMLNRMSKHAIKALVWRRYKPLLELIESAPERFSEEIKQAVQQSADVEQNRQPVYSDLDALREEFSQFRHETTERLDALLRYLSRHTG